MADELKLWGQRRIAELKQDMDRLFEDFCQDLGLPDLGRDAQSSLPVDILETDEAYVARFTLGDVHPDALEVEVTERAVSLKLGREERLPGGGVSRRAVCRSLALPGAVNAHGAQAVLREGVLEVLLPKTRRHPGLPVRITPRKP